MIPVYRGVQHQYGYGLGSLFKAALRTVTPLVKTGLHALKKEGIKQGIGAAQDIFLHGKKTKNVLLSRAKETARAFGETLLQKPKINKRKPQKRSQLQSTSRRRRIISKKRRTNQRHLDIFD